jgi:Sulphur transport
MSFVIAILISFLMGLAIQRGGTCTVAAIHEIVHKRTANRVKALIETALWVLAGELILAKAGLFHLSIQNWQIIPATILGALLLGLGAFINGACTVGTIARIGNREWDFLAMIPGFFTGALVMGWLKTPDILPINIGMQSIPAIPSWILILVSTLILLRIGTFIRKGLHPYVLTVLIGIFFLGLVAIDKAWSYTDLIIDLALFKDQGYIFRAFLFAALLLGAILSGSYQDSNNFSLKKLTPNVFKRFFGGAIMGIATIILPGSHDSLILLYMPMLLGYAWLGFVIMASTIFTCKFIKRKLNGA